MAKTICWIQRRKIEVKKYGDKDGKALHRLMNNAVHGKTMENLRNRIDVRLMSNKEDYLKWTSKPSYMSQNLLFGNDLIAIRKSKVTLKHNKPAYAAMSILDLSKVINIQVPLWLHKNKYGNNSKLLMTDTDSLMYGTKTEDIYEDFSKDKEMLDFSSYST